ncbi:MAG TPA: phosphopantetheine-binding protein [Myxococcales bacterium]|jgi:acyl carrier protein
MEQTLEQKIKEKLVETLELKISPDKIDDNAPLFIEGLGLDSVDALEVAAMLSMHFDVEITDKDSAKTVLSSIKSIADYVRKIKPQA